MVPKGTEGNVVKFSDDGVWTHVEFPRTKGFKKFYTASAYLYLTGFSKQPTEKALERMVHDGIAKTVTGETVEPDGTGFDGAPSWLLALGYI